MPTSSPGARRLAPTGRGRAAATLVSLGLSLTGLTGCSDVAAQLQGSPETSDAGDVRARPLLKTLEWSELNGLVSVTVRNPTNQVLRRAEAEITVLDERGRILVSSSTSGIEADCCTAVNVPPDTVAGFYIQVPEDGDRAADVQVDYRDVTWSGTSSAGGAVAEAVSSSLRRNSLGTLITARLDTSAGIIERALVQATVEDADGELLAVVSTTWDCLRPDRLTPVRLQLFHRVPEDAAVGTISVFPDDRNRGDRPAPECA